MITLNLNDIKILSELLLILKELKGVNDSILLYDMPEGSRLGPTEKREFSNKSINKSHIARFFFIAHETLQYHKFDVWYLCSDLNIKNRYTNWCEFLNVKKKFKVLCFPFTVKPQNVEYIKQQHINYYNNTEKKKNFIQLICNPTIPRIRTVDRYYKHRNYDYSLVPQFHRVSHRKGYSYYKDDFQSIKLKNKFDIEKNLRTLTEIELSNVDGNWDDVDTIFIDGKKLNKMVFNHFLPIESFESCCDVVLESYLTGPTYFTEKTWKQILLEKPFIMIGAKGINHHLRDMGFKLYDEIFNYDYDLEDNELARLKGFWAQIERYLDLDVSEFEKKFELIKEKLIYNRNLYLKTISSIQKTFQNDTRDDIYLFNYLYLHPKEIAKQQYLLDDHFETIKKSCLEIYRYPKRICDLK